MPFDREVEQKTLELYQEFINHFQKEFTTALEDDENEEGELKNYEERVAVALRIEYKKILLGQNALVNKCLSFLKKWKVNQIQDFEESEMKWIKRIKSYLLGLEKAVSLWFVNISSNYPLCKINAFIYVKSSNEIHWTTLGNSWAKGV